VTACILNRRDAVSRVLVIGDVMLDRYLWGISQRLSPEAPVPVVQVTNESIELGGAANVAANVIALGCKCTLVGAVGKDDEAFKLAQLAREFGIDDYLVPETHRHTTVKCRVIAGSQHVVRIDREMTTQLYAKSRARVERKVFNLLVPVDTIHSVIISDYNKGVCNPSFVEEVIKSANDAEIPVFIDPKGMDWSKYVGAFCVTPNYKEFCEYTHQEYDSIASIARQAQHIAKMLNVNNIIITKGGDGMVVVPRKGTYYHSKAKRIDVADVSGAGDTVIAALATMKAGSPKVNMNRAADYANTAAAVAVSRLGTSPVWAHEVIDGKDDVD